MRRRYITVAIVLLAVTMLYFNYKVTEHYYSLNFYNVDMKCDKDEIVFNGAENVSVIHVSLENKTRKILSSEKNVFLAYHIVDKEGDDVQFENGRTSIPVLNPYNKVEDVPMEIFNINKKGNYTVQIDLVEENVTWFSEKGNAMLVIDMVVQ